MPHFFDLPRELRDRILELVVAQRVTPPDVRDPSALRIGRTAIHDVPTGPWAGTRSIFYEDEPQVNRVHSIFAVNRQLRLEAYHALDRTKLTGFHELDIVILDETNLIPTWTYAPTLTSRVDTLKVTFRVANSGSSSSPQWQHHAGLETGIWSNTSYARSVFQSLLSIMLKANHRGKDAPICVNSREDVAIKCLDIVVLDPQVSETDHTVLRKTTYYYGAEMYRSTHALEPVYLLGLLAYHIRCSPSEFHSTIIHGELLYVYINCAQLLFEHVETVVLRCNGVQYWTCDMGERLGQLGIQEPYAYGERCNNFGQWKELIHGKRKRLGLST
jgi:hypothetical protein